MNQAAQERRQIAIALAVASAIAWVVMLSRHPGSSMSPHAHHGNAASAFSADYLLGWCLMLVAMMAPALASPLFHVRERSFRRMRAPSMALFITGYLFIWMLAGLAILQITTVVSLAEGTSVLLPLSILLIALIWQCSPFKQRCLNRSRNHSALRAFGWAARFDVVGFGLRHGLWCVGSCWLLMLFPMTLTTGQLPAMAVVTIVIITEKLAPPGAPRWRIRGHETAIAIVRGQIQSRMSAREPLNNPARARRRSCRMRGST